MSELTSVKVDSGPRSSIRESLLSPVDIDFLVYFRVIFGGVMLYWVVKYCVDDLVTAYYVAPRFHFHYFGFAWVHPWADPWMHRHFYALGLFAVLMILGCCYRLSSLLFALGFTYVFLIDKCLYQNHYYLVCLVAWLMTLLPAHRAFSLDALLRPKSRQQRVPSWILWLLRFQVGLPYFFGGIAKLNPDWLAGEPMRTMLAERATFPVVGSFFTEEWCVQLFVWGGLLFDLFVVPALLWARTRRLAFAVAVCFHLMNAWLFTIGIFPWFMILATVIYFPPGSLRKRFRQAPLQTIEPADMPTGQYRFRGKLIACVLSVYVIVQLVMPLRHFVQAGNPSWTEEGHYFAWHMLLRGKKSAVRYYARDPNTGRTGTIDLRDYVTPFQLSRCSRDPRMLHELAQFIAADLRKLGFANVEIRVLALVSMNGRKPQLMIDPNVDLADEPITWKQPHWIVPLREPLRDVPWDAPLSEWERLLAPPKPAD